MPDNALAVAVPAGYRDWRSVASLAVDAVSSAHSKRAYQKALKDFVAWYSAEARPPFSRAVVQQYRSLLESAGLAPASINLRLSAIRKLAQEAAENGLLDRSVAQGIVSLKGVRQSGNRAGNWLTREQARDLLAQPERETTEGKRDRAILLEGFLSGRPPYSSTPPHGGGRLDYSEVADHREQAPGTVYEITVDGFKRLDAEEKRWLKPH